MADQIALRTSETLVPAGSAVSVYAAFRDRATAAASAPTSIRYRVDCLTNGRNIIHWTNATAAATATVVVPGPLNATIDRESELEQRQLTVEIDTGLDTQARQAITWRVRNVRTYEPAADFEPIDYTRYEPFFPITEAETAAGLVEDNLLTQYLPGDIRRYGTNAEPGVTDMTAAVQRAISVAQAGGGSVDFLPPGQAFGISDPLLITASNVRLNLNGCNLRILEAMPAAICVGNIEGLLTSEDNTLASNAAQGATSVTLAAGKGANFSVDEWFVIRSTAAFPDRDSSVTQPRAEFAQVKSIAGDVLTLYRPLMYAYTTAASGRADRVPWITGIEINDLGIDGNDHTSLPIAVMFSWCFAPRVSNYSSNKAEQRGLRFQGCMNASVNGLNVRDGLSDGVDGESSVFSYVLVEAGLNEGLTARDLHVERCRHGYTTVEAFSTNAAVSFGTLFGEPYGSIISDGIHIAARGAGWDTHPIGRRITFRNLKTLGGVHHGFQDRAQETTLDGCYAADCIGAAFQFGGTTRYFTLNNGDYDRCALGTDPLTSTDWSDVGPVSRSSSSLGIIGPGRQQVIQNGNAEIWTGGAGPYTSDGETADDWILTEGSGETISVTREALASSNDPSRYLLRFSRSATGSAASSIRVSAPFVRLMAGRRACLSFFSRSDASSGSLEVAVAQYFGTGGSPSSDVAVASYTFTLSASFRLYSLPIVFPSVSNKTLGTDVNDEVRVTFTWPLANGNTFVDLDMVRLDLGGMPLTYISTDW